jgi:hypothetical protein
MKLRLTRADAATAEAPNGVFTYKKKTYAVGLFWVTHADGSLSAAARDTATELGDDLYCLRDTVVAQFATGRAANGHKTGMVAAAAVAADTFEGTWHGVFPTPSGWWYIAVRDDAILPTGDRLFDDENQARDHLLSEAASSTWPRTYAPSEWNIEGATPPDLDVALSTKSSARLRGLRSNTPVRLIAASAIALLAVAAVAYQLSDLFSEPEIVFAPATPKAVAQAQTAPPPWTTEANPAQWMPICHATLKHIFLDLQGWDAVEAGCNATHAAAVWKRRHATISDIEPALTAANLRQFSKVENQGDTLRVAVPLPIPAKQPLTQPDLRADAAQRLLWASFQSINEKIQINPGTIEQATPAAAAQLPFNGPPASVKHPILNLTLASAYDPSVIVTRFIQPGLAIKEARWTASNQRWTYTGILYLAR